MQPSLWWSVDFADVARFCSAAGKHNVALQACALGLRLRPGDPLLLLRRAQAHDALGRFDSAIADCAQALRAAADPAIAAQASATLALALESHGSGQAAVDAAALGVAADPAAVEPHCALGNVLAWHGDWDRAWPELECHWLSERDAVHQRFGMPEWNGEELDGKRVVAVHMQGMGDLLLMARYLPLLRSRCAHLTVECAPALAPLLREVPGVDAVLPLESVRAADIDAVTRVMTLPRIFGERFETRSAPYLHVPPGAHERLPRRLPDDKRLRVGLAWAGNPFHLRDRVRSMTIDDCLPLNDVGGVTWASLQIGPHANDASRAEFPLERYDDVIRDMGDTAALIAQLDLVIAVDTAVAHLAGALGKPVWLMLSQRPDWRWPHSGSTTPWYGSMRLFHATEPGWSGVVSDVSRSLRELAERP